MNQWFRNIPDSCWITKMCISMRVNWPMYFLWFGQRLVLCDQSLPSLIECDLHSCSKTGWHDWSILMWLTDASMECSQSLISRQIRSAMFEYRILFIGTPLDGRQVNKAAFSNWPAQSVLNKRGSSFFSRRNNFSCASSIFPRKKEWSYGALQFEKNCPMILGCSFLCTTLS